VAAVVHRVLLTIIQPGNRRLTDADLLALVVDTASVLVSRPDFEAAIQNIGAGMAGAGAAIESVQLSRLLEPERDLPLPPILAERNEITAVLLARAQRYGIGFVTGSTGCGKTTVARLTARVHGSQWNILDLRDASAEQTSQRLDLALGALGRSDSAGIILDDLNEIEDRHARRALSRFLSTLRRRDILCLITAYRKPSTRSFSELGIDETTHLAVPDLAEPEVAAMVSASGGDAKKWAAAVQRASAFGHPQLVQAVISGLRTRGWPDGELKSLRAFDPSLDIEAERLAARNRLVAVLPEKTSTLLYRISLLFGRFDRPLALAVGAISPAVPEPGVHLDQLIGPWIEPSTHGNMRVSPLLQHAGTEILAPDDTKRVHQTAAENILGGRRLGVDKANSGFLHALFGESEWLLMRLAHNIIATTAETRRQLSDWMASLRLHRLDRRIVSDRPALSILLRLAQFLLIAPTGRPNAIRNCWHALGIELAELEDTEAREQLEYMIVAKALFTEEAIAFLPDVVGLILRLEELSQREPERRDLLNQRTPSPDGSRTHGLLGTLFITYALRMPSVADLQRAFGSLDTTTDTLRAALLDDIFDMPSDFALVSITPGSKKANVRSRIGPPLRKHIAPWPRRRRTGAIASCRSAASLPEASSSMNTSRTHPARCRPSMRQSSFSGTILCLTAHGPRSCTGARTMRAPCGCCATQPTNWSCRTRSPAPTCCEKPASAPPNSANGWKLGNGLPPRVKPRSMQALPRCS
jgi:hypothetical protein